MNTSGILFVFENDELVKLLDQQIEIRRKEIDALEMHLPELRKKVDEIGRTLGTRVQAYFEATQALEAGEVAMTHAKSAAAMLCFYAAHAPPGQTTLNLNDVHQLGFLDRESGIARALVPGLKQAYKG